jgi:hypothetical protein
MASRDATQAKILDAFTEEVTIRLIEMTDAWDSHAVLLAATKRAQRRKGLLRQELLTIRRERGDVQREMEGVRQGHEKGELEMKDLRLQHDFIGEMEEFKERIGSNGEEDNVKVTNFLVFVGWYTDFRTVWRLRCWRLGRWLRGRVALLRDWLLLTGSWNDSTMPSQMQLLNYFYTNILPYKHV